MIYNQFNHRILQWTTRFWSQHWGLGSSAGLFPGWVPRWPCPASFSCPSCCAVGWAEVHCKLCIFGQQQKHYENTWNILKLVHYVHWIICLTQSLVIQFFFNHWPSWFCHRILSFSKFPFSRVQYLRMIIRKIEKGAERVTLRVTCCLHLQLQVAYA